MRFLSHAPFRPLFVFFATLSVVALAAELATAQSKPSDKTLAPSAQVQFLAYWTTETGWHSELQLRNNLSHQDLTVTPALRTPDGTETPLGPVTLKPNEVQSFDLETAVGAAAPQLIATHGSVVLRFTSPTEGNLYAALMLRNIGHSIAFHTDATGVIPAYDAASREGVWWLPNDAATDYLILANYGDAPMPLVLTLFDAAGKRAQQKLSLGPRETTRLSVRALVNQGGLTGSYGGITVYAAAHAGSLDTLHFLFDQKAGFSALLKMFDHDPNATMQERDFARTSVWTLRAPLLALSQPDPVMAFPANTVLQPQLFVRNTTAKPLSAVLRFNWKGDTTTGKSQGPSLQLRPYETRRVDVSALQDGATLPRDARWTSVTLTTNSQPDEIMAVAASYDATLQHGAQTPFSDQLSFAGEGGMWEYDAQHNSLIAVGNGGAKPTKAAFTIFYNQGSQRYDLEQTLQPDEQMWVDVGKLIREHVPDKNGNVLPAGLTSGSYEFRDLNDKQRGTLFEGKVIYEKTYGHVVYGCVQCCYYAPNSWLVYDPLGIPLLGGAQDTVIGQDCNGINVDITGFFDGGWSTVNTAVATVDSGGYHTGVGLGSTTTNLFGSVPERRGLKCPLVRQTPHGGDNVTKPGFLQVVSNSPDTNVCLGLSCGAILKYKVLDVNRQAMNIAGMTIAESVSSISGSCSTSSVTDSSTWQTDSTGTMIGTDELFVCCNGATCSISWNQTFTVNGFGVIILSQDGVTTGTKNVISVACTSGNGSCPRIAITP